MIQRKGLILMTAVLTMILLLLTLFSPSSEAQVEVDPDQQYLLLAARRTGTMQEELDQAATLGFRVVTSSPTSGDEVVILMKREQTDKYKYQLLATSRTSTMQEELDAGAEAGFRFLSQTPICKSRRFGTDEIVLVMEHSPNSDQRYEYKLLATSQTSTLQDEITEEVTNGFSLAGIVSCYEHIVILEREST